MGGICSTYGVDLMDEFKISAGKSERKRPLGRFEIILKYFLKKYIMRW
jgi:hypothetical protein